MTQGNQIDLDITQYDSIFAGISGGKDSAAMALWIKNRSGWPLDKVTFGFCETENEDPLTYAFINLLGKKLEIPIQTLHPGLGFFDAARRHGRFPSRKARFCTTELKIWPKQKYFAELIDAGGTPINVTGVRRAEGAGSNNRATTDYLEYETFRRKRKNYVLANCHPLAYWAMQDVWQIHQEYITLAEVTALVEADPTMLEDRKDRLIAQIKESGIPRNPLYDMGATRVGCFPCINSRKLEIRAMAYYRPERIDFIREQETSVKPDKNISTFFARKTVPLHLRSKKIIAADGTAVYVCTIDDVVLWSQTAHGGTQLKMNFDLTEDGSACQIGADCE